MSLVSSVIQSATRGLGFRASENWPGRYTIDAIAGMFRLGEVIPNFTLQPFKEVVSGDYVGLIEAAYRGNAIVFACELVRFSLFSEARFQFQQLRNGRPGDLFGNADLGILEKPEPGKTTGDLLGRALLDADFAGSWYGVRRPGRIKRLRPDWTAILMGSPNRAVELPAHDPDIEVIGYAYWPGGQWSGSEPMTFGVDEIAHFAPIPDPIANYRGMSWLTPVIRELKADSAATQHKLQFFEHAATPNAIVKFEPGFDPAKVREFIEIFEQNHSGVLNAYATAYLGGGADMEVVGSTLKDMDYKNVQGGGETRIAATAGVHPTIVGLSEGLQGASLNAGNFGAARRLTADKTLRPLWRNMAGSLETIIPTPAGSRLWYDDRDVAFLSEDVKDAAEVLSLEASAIRTLGDGGWVPDSVVEAVTSGDLRRLVATGYLPVQLQSVRPEDVEQTDQEVALLTAPSIAGLLPSVASGEVRCPSCNKLAGELVTAPYRFTCTNPKCRTVIENIGDIRISQVAQIEARPVDPPQVNVTISEGAIQVNSPVTIERGAVEVSSPVTVESSPVTISEGALQVHSPVTIERGAVEVDVPVTVESSPVTISEGALQVHSPVTIERGAVEVEPSPVTIAEGAVQVEVHAPPMTIERGAVQVDVSNPVTVEPTSVTIEEGAVQVTTPEIRVDSPITVEPTNVTIAEGAIRATIEPAQVTIAEGALQTRVEPSPVTIVEQKPMRTVIDFDRDGEPVGSHEERMDAS